MLQDILSTYLCIFSKKKQFVKNPNLTCGVTVYFYISFFQSGLISKQEREHRIIQIRFSIFTSLLDIITDWMYINNNLKKNPLLTLKLKNISSLLVNDISLLGMTTRKLSFLNKVENTWLHIFSIFQFFHQHLFYIRLL